DEGLDPAAAAAVLGGVPERLERRAALQSVAEDADLAGGVDAVAAVQCRAFDADRMAVEALPAVRHSDDAGRTAARAVDRCRRLRARAEDALRAQAAPVD